MSSSFSSTVEVTSQHWDDTIRTIQHLSKQTVEQNIQLKRRVVALQNELDCRQETLVQPCLILCIIDGNSFLFRPELLSQGLPGGRQAALGLSQHIAECFSLQRSHALDQVSFWMTIYHSRPFLLDMVHHHRLCTKDQLEAFFNGFSSTSPKFSVVDVGHSKNCVSAKITEHVVTFTQFSQTARIFLAVGEQFFDILSILGNEKHLEKIVFLRKNSLLTSPNRFPSQWLEIQNLFHSTDLSLACTLPPPGGFISNGGLLSPDSPNSLPTEVQGSPRLIDPNLPLHKQNPPPCNEYYLMECSKGVTCKYSHGYLLTRQQLQELANSAKKAPCNWLKNGVNCPHGDKCCWGHRCPGGSKCYHLSKGRCWFKGDFMHVDVTPLGSPPLAQHNLKVVELP